MFHNVTHTLKIETVAVGRGDFRCLHELPPRWLSSPKLLGTPYESPDEFKFIRFNVIVRNSRMSEKSNWRRLCAQTRQGGKKVMTVVCAWCKKTIGKKNGPEVISHGICKKCADRERTMMLEYLGKATSKK